MKVLDKDLKYAPKKNLNKCNTYVDIDLISRNI